MRNDYVREENGLSLIKKKVNASYINMTVLSLVTFLLFSYFVYSLLTLANRNDHAFVYFILSCTLASISAFSIINILLIVICAISDNIFNVNITICQMLQSFLYIGFIIILVYKKIFKINIWLTILAIFITIILFAIVLIPSRKSYENIFLINQLIPRTEQMIISYSEYQHAVNEYNEKVLLYNDIKQRIGNVGYAIGKKYRCKAINQFQDYIDIPQINVSYIQIFNCSYIRHYLNEIIQYQTNVNRVSYEMNQQSKYIDSVIDKKADLLQETERNVERIQNPEFTDKLRQIFKDSTKPAFKSLKKLKGQEKKIKSIKGDHYGE